MISAVPDFAAARNPHNRDLFTRVLLHFAVAPQDDDAADALLTRVFAAFRAADLGTGEVLALFRLAQFARLANKPWTRRATLADGAPIDPAFVCAQLERAARLVGLLSAAHFQVVCVCACVRRPAHTNFKKKTKTNKISQKSNPQRPP